MYKHPDSHRWAEMGMPATCNLEDIVIDERFDGVQMPTIACLYDTNQRRNNSLT